MQLIDTHCHIYSSDFDADRPAMLERAKAAGLVKMLMPAIDAEWHEPMLQLEQQYQGECMAMMGLHPCSVKADYETELASVRDYFEKRRFIAVGEIGLDFYWDLNFKEQQLDAFRQQVKWALEFEVPIVIHSRESTDECIRIVEEFQDGKLKGVFHCFSGNLVQARKIMDLGFYLGIGGVLTFKNSGLDKVMQETGLERVVLETDAPYLAPVPFRGKRNECSYLRNIAQKLADIKQIGIDEVAAITTENARHLFAL